MIELLIIGAIACILDILILKVSRDVDEPILRAWHVIALGISAFIPIWSAILGVSVLLSICIAHVIGDLGWKESKFGTFLNKKIS